MKNLVVRSVLGLSLVMLASACSQVEFKKLAESSKAAEIDPSDPDYVPPVNTPPPPAPSPVAEIPPPVVAPPVVVLPPAPTLSKGVCAADSSTALLSCMNCLVPALPPVVSQFSNKGRALFEIMVASCQVPNGSDPVGYRPPTRADLMRRLNRLSPTLYPDSPMSAIQISTINSLLTDSTALQKMFGGIFYSGVTPTTTAFETYFGIETIEARYSLCYDNGSMGTPNGFDLKFTRLNATPLNSKVYLDCLHSDQSYFCTESAEYITANKYRNQLRNAMTESLNNPYVPSGSTGVQQTCSWEKFDGLAGTAAADQVKAWLAGGFTIGAELSAQRMCAMVTAPLAILDGSAITMAAYRCK